MNIFCSQFYHHGILFRAEKKKEKEKQEKQEEGNEKEVKHSEWNTTAQMLGRKSSLFATNHSLALSNMHTLNV